MSKCIFRIVVGIVLLLVTTAAPAQQPADYVQQVIDNRAERYKNMALQLWDFAELGYQE